MSAGTEQRDLPGSLQLFSEVLLVGVLVCVACLPLVTVLAAGGAGATSIRELVEADRTPRVRRFVSLIGTALRDPVGWFAPLVLLMVGTLDTVAVLGGVPGGTVLGPVIGLAVVLGVICGARSAARWRPDVAWRDVLADAGPTVLRDWPGSVLLAGALVVVVIVGVQVPAFVVILPGLLVMAAVAIEHRLPSR
ncbi:MAG TPA: hypothetical protein VEL02_10370 [Jatrophihabitantaceae bacterium]|nr:hypothetical protein [Jatrophihabitantaceae bacterium]